MSLRLRWSMFLLLAITSLAQAAEPKVVYREIFPAGRKSLAKCGWKIYVNADARDASGGRAISGAFADRRGFEAVNSDKEKAENAKKGNVYIKNAEDGKPYLMVANDMPLIAPPLNAISWQMSLGDAKEVVHPVVCIDIDKNGKPSKGDAWFISATPIKDPKPGAKGFRPITFDVAKAKWLKLEMKLGTRRSGSGKLPTDVKKLKPITKLPAGNIVSAGLYSPAKLTRPRFDTFEVKAAGTVTPKAGSKDKAAALLKKYADQMITASTIDERWPHMIKAVEARGQQPTAAWSPKLDFTVAGRTLYVHGDLGDDQHDGLSSNKPWRTLSHAFAQLQPGDALLVGPGTYYQPTLWLRDLTPGSEEDLAKPTYIRAEPRGAAKISSAWPDVAEGLVKWVDEGNGIWSAPFPTRKGDPRSMGGYTSADGSVYFMFGMMNLADLMSDAVPLKKKWDRFSKTNPMPWPGYGYVMQGGRCWLRTPNGENPNGRPLIVSTYTNHETSLIRLDNASHVIIDGFHFEGAGDKAVRANRNSPYLTVRNAIIEYCRGGVGPDDYGLVEWCEYTFPGYKRFADDLKALMLSKNVHVMNPMFGFVKKYHGAQTEGHLVCRPWTTPKDNRGIGPLNCEARYNYCHQTFDGDTPGAWSESSVHHSVYVYQYDNASELEAGKHSEGRNTRFHDNLIVASLYGAISHQDKTINPMGPQWVYRNVVIGNFPKDYQGPGKVIYGEVDSAEDAWTPWIFSKYLAPNADAINYDHNLVWLRSGGLLWAKESTVESRAKMNWRNNVIVFDPKGLTTYTEPYNFTAASNMWVGPVARPDVQGAGGVHLPNLAALRWRDPMSLDFRPAEGSPLINAGVVINNEPSSMAGDQPDVGPFAFGAFDQPMPGDHWPRPRTRMFNPAPPDALAGQTKQKALACE